jgi:DNA-binding response OmpR family regulator
MRLCNAGAAKRNNCALWYLTVGAGRKRPVSELPLILVIEDEYVLQGFVDDALTEAGFATEIFSSVEEALTLYQSGKYKALVTDIGLKGTWNGWEGARQVREREPNLPIIYMTGAAADAWASQGVPGSILLCKPFAPAQLVTAVSQLINAAGPLTDPIGQGSGPA